jgi:hypothetical protein
MAGFDTAIANAILDCYFRATNITAPTNIYLALFNTGTELTGNGYARTDVTGKFSAAASKAITNNAAVDCPTASGAWSAVDEWRIYTASSGGTMIRSNTCSLAALSANQFHRIPIGDLDISLDAA